MVSSGGHSLVRAMLKGKWRRRCLRCSGSSLGRAAAFQHWFSMNPMKSVLTHNSFVTFCHWCRILFTIHITNFTFLFMESTNPMPDLSELSGPEGTACGLRPSHSFRVSQSPRAHTASRAPRVLTMGPEGFVRARPASQRRRPIVYRPFTKNKMTK